MPQKVCMEPRCAKLVAANGRGRCAVHARDRDRTINRAGRAVYGTKRWALTRRHKLFLDPFCETEGCREVATDVHHKHGVEANPWAIEGLESLCRSHHSRITRAGQVA